MSDQDDEVYKSRLQGRANLINERGRLDLDFEEVARLSGLREEHYRSVEWGGEDITIDLCKYLVNAGFDPLYVLGLSDEPEDESVKGLSKGLCFKADSAFADTLMLLLKSKQAVDLVFGKGTAEREPSLVKTFMESTLFLRREKVRAAATDGYSKELSGSMRECAEILAAAVSRLASDSE